MLTGFLGAGIGIGTLFFAARAAYYAKRAAEETMRGSDAAAKSVAAAHESNEISRQSLLMANRPWIIIEDLEFHSVDYDSFGANITFSYTLKNIGNSPALLVRPRYHAISNFFLDNIPALFLKIREDHAAYSEENYGEIIVPRGIVKFESLRIQIKSGDNKFPPSSLSPFVIVSVLYDASGYDSSRQVFEVFRITPEDSSALAITAGDFDPDLAIPRKFQPGQRIVSFRMGPYAIMT